MTNKRKERPVVHLSIVQEHGVARMDWYVQYVDDSGSAPRKGPSRRVFVRFDETLTVPHLTRVLARMADYVLARVPGSRITPRSTEWWEDRASVHVVPPSGGEGGEVDRHRRIGRTDDTAQQDAALPSVYAPPGGVGGPERSEDLSEVDLRGELAGQTSIADYLDRG